MNPPAIHFSPKWLNKFKTLRQLESFELKIDTPNIRVWIKNPPEGSFTKPVIFTETNVNGEWVHSDQPDQ